MQRFSLIRKKVKKSNKPIKFDQVLGIPYFVILILLIVLPILILVVYSFLAENQAFELRFSLSHYINFFKEPLFIKSMGRSLGIAFISTAFCLIIGYPLAYIIAMGKARTSSLLILLITSPMWINMILRVQALKQVFEMIMPRFYLTESALIIGMVYIFLPFMVLPIYTVLAKMDKSLFEASADLGATKFKTIVKVVIPLSITGILSGITMVFLPIATTLVVPKYLGPSGRNLIGNIIEQAITKRQYGSYGYGAAIAVVLALIMVVLVNLMNRADRYQGGSKDED